MRFASYRYAKWTRESSGNYLWLAQLGLELAKEFRYRFKKVHSCEAHIQWLEDNLPLTITMSPRISFPIAMDENIAFQRILFDATAIIIARENNLLLNIRGAMFHTGYYSFANVCIILYINKNLYTHNGS